MYKIHRIYLDNFRIETRLKTVNSGGKNLGFGGGFGYRNNTIRVNTAAAVVAVHVMNAPGCSGRCTVSQA